MFNLLFDSVVSWTQMIFSFEHNTLYKKLDYSIYCIGIFYTNLPDTHTHTILARNTHLSL